MDCKIVLENLGHRFGAKLCFAGFNHTIYYGNRIAIIGRNGSGKSTLLQILRGNMTPSDGNIHSSAMSIGYVAQTISDYPTLSGGQRFNKALSQIIATAPDIICLDEPSNHLDHKNRQSLMRMLQHYAGTLIIVTHDVELLRYCTDQIWHINDGKITVFNGDYDEYLANRDRQREQLLHKLQQLKREKKKSHESLMREQQRAKKRKDYGKKKYHGDKLALSAKKRQGETTHGKNKKALAESKENILQQLQDLNIEEIIVAKFDLPPGDYAANKIIIGISAGSCGYAQPVLRDINLQIFGGSKVVIRGNNGSGKSTLFKAMLNDPAISRHGDWHIPPLQRIGYLDQHYRTLAAENSVLETIQLAAPDWSPTEVRRHLNDFLFRNNDEVTATVTNLSGGERARLSLAQIAAQAPKLLLLDEMTNNLDLESREHVIEVLQNYPGTVVAISHDEDFIERIGVNAQYHIEKNHLYAD